MATLIPDLLPDGAKAVVHRTYRDGSQAGYGRVSGRFVLVERAKGLPWLMTAGPFGGWSDVADQIDRKDHNAANTRTT